MNHKALKEIYLIRIMIMLKQKFNKMSKLQLFKIQTIQIF